MIIKRKVLFILVLVLTACHCFSQDIRVCVLNYNHTSKKVTVKVENNSNDTIWYALFPIYFFQNKWSEPKCEIEDNATLRSLINAPKRVSAFLKLGGKSEIIREGYATESMMDWLIYNGTHKLYDAPKYSKRWWQIFKKEKKNYNFFEMDKRIMLKGTNLRTGEEFECYSELFK